MKTIDEVIEAQERCETYPDCHFCYLHSGPICEWIRDALHYLKDMKNLKEDYDILYDKYWRDFSKQQENPPLTWDELRQMEGKPVWVEYFGANRWIIPQEFRFDIAGREYLLAQDGGMIFRFQQHDVWQAYRKERYEDN